MIALAVVIMTLVVMKMVLRWKMLELLTGNQQTRHLENGSNTLQYASACVYEIISVHV